MNKVKVLIVDDSALIRQFLADTLSKDSSIEVVGTAIDPVFAFAKIMKTRPDVITLDVEMPRMDGLTFLKKLMEADPIPVVMISSQTKKGCETTMRAMELGAVDFITKPDSNLNEKLDSLRDDIICKVKNAANANLRVSARGGGVQSAGKRPLPAKWAATVRPKLIIIGASTGGVAAVRQILQSLDARSISVLLVLHMPEGFTTAFAAKLDALVPYSVKEAASGEFLRPGVVYVAPGGKNIILEKESMGLRICTPNCSPGDIYRPSVDKAFISVAKTAGPQAVAIILTGMGDDGARGMALLRQAGAYTIAQSKETAVVFGMPGKAIEMGGVLEILDLERIAGRINQIIYRNKR